MSVLILYDGADSLGECQRADVPAGSHLTGPHRLQPSMQGIERALSACRLHPTPATPVTYL